MLQELVAVFRYSCNLNMVAEYRKMDVTCYHVASSRSNSVRFGLTGPHQETITSERILQIKRKWFFPQSIILRENAIPGVHSLLSVFTAGTTAFHNCWSKLRWRGLARDCYVKPSYDGANPGCSLNTVTLNNFV
jgi:hypothetical protein